MSIEIQKHNFLSFIMLISNMSNGINIIMFAIPSNSMPKSPLKYSLYVHKKSILIRYCSFVPLQNIADPQKESKYSINKKTNKKRTLLADGSNTTTIISNTKTTIKNIIYSRVSLGLNAHNHFIN